MDVADIKYTANFMDAAEIENIRGIVHFLNDMNNMNSTSIVDGADIANAVDIANMFKYNCKY